MKKQTCKKERGAFDEHAHCYFLPRADLFSILFLREHRCTGLERAIDKKNVEINERVEREKNPASLLEEQPECACNEKYL